MNLLNKIQYNQFWNIGFCEQTIDDLMSTRKIHRITWLNHPYRDRWFADPFILHVTENEIVVFVEECLMENPKGVLCELVIDRKKFRLKERFVILELDTHLSYPAIIRNNDKVYVYPENGASGKLNIYEYDRSLHRLINPICILEEAVADATIMEYNNSYYLSATKFPETQEKAYLYTSDSLFGPFTQISDTPYFTKKCGSRQGGNWIRINGKVYRPTQDCIKRYGNALCIMEMSGFPMFCSGTEYLYLKPVGTRFGLGLHTINFENNVCVVDGYGHFLPLWGRLYYSRFTRGIISLFR